MGREPIPRLEEVLELVRERGVEVLVELKDPRALERVVELIRGYGLVQRSYITSFFYSVALGVRRLEPGIRRGVIVVGELVVTEELVGELR